MYITNNPFIFREVVSTLNDQPDKDRLIFMATLKIMHIYHRFQQGTCLFSEDRCLMHDDFHIGIYFKSMLIARNTFVFF